MPLEIPKDLQALRTSAGHKKGLKILVSGPPKTGKSFLLASMPKVEGKVRVYFDGCEEGIQGYLDPEDVCFTIATANHLERAMGWVLKNKDQICALGVDPITTIWTDFLESWEDELGVEELKGGDWKKVKPMWKRFVRGLQRAPFHVGISAWRKDTEWKEAAGAPGMGSKLEINKVEQAAVEKTVPYVYDIYFQTSIETDAKGIPNGTHLLTLIGGRRPRTVPPNEFYTGRQWKFNARKPVPSVWKEVIGPFYDRWQEGAVEYIGALDGEGAEKVGRELQEAADDGELGRLTKLVQGCTGKEDWESRVKVELNSSVASLSREHQECLLEVVKGLKIKLGI